MSKTIITNSGSDFFTNISTERLLGELLRECGAKHHVDELFGSADMPYEMTAEEAKQASKKLFTLLDRSFELWLKVRPHFRDNHSREDLEDFIKNMAITLKNSKGYECLF